MARKVKTAIKVCTQPRSQGEATGGSSSSMTEERRRRSSDAQLSGGDDCGYAWAHDDTQPERESRIHVLTLSNDAKRRADATYLRQIREDNVVVVTGGTIQWLHPSPPMSPRSGTPSPGPGSPPVSPKGSVLHRSGSRGPT
jgi:hypothetical protein